MTGDDDIPTELLRSGGESILCSLSFIIVESSLGSVPQQWKNSKMVTVKIKVIEQVQSNFPFESCRKSYGSCCTVQT